ncbi:hypothetical protein GGI12_001924 [Dipsacomyces acuminosporus]|nr:hypothetical protein GGI12_001924 [Dipsacomyces acuminosporus]
MDSKGAAPAQTDGGSVSKTSENSSKSEGSNGDKGKNNSSSINNNNKTDRPSPTQTDAPASESGSRNDSKGVGITLKGGASPTKTGDGSSPSSSSTSSSSSSNGQPGRIEMKTPPKSVESPLFEIASKVKLQWDYDSNMKKPPSRISIRGQMPSDIHEPGTNKPLYWYIAQNVSAELKSYTWDTITESPPGYTLREGPGYKLYIYDSDIGWENSTHVYPGKLFQFMLPFSMYNSRYGQTNDGVPKNYNPNAATRSTSASAGIWVAVLAATISALAALN